VFEWLKRLLGLAPRAQSADDTLDPGGHDYDSWDDVAAMTDHGELDGVDAAVVAAEKAEAEARLAAQRAAAEKAAAETAAAEQAEAARQDAERAARRAAEAAAAAAADEPETEEAHPDAVETDQPAAASEAAASEAAASEAAASKAAASEAPASEAAASEPAASKAAASEAAASEAEAEAEEPAADDAAGATAPEPAETAEASPAHTYDMGSGVFVRKRGFFVVASVRVDGSMELQGSDPAAAGLLDYDAEEVARLFRPAVDAQLAGDYEAMLRRPLVGLDLPEDPASLAARVDEAMAIGELGGMVGVLRDLYGQPLAALDQARLKLLEDTVFGELCHVLGLDLAELREAARDQTPAFGETRPPVRGAAAAEEPAAEEPAAEEPAAEEPAAEEPAVEEPAAPDGVPAGWQWRGSMTVAKGVVLGEDVGSDRDKDKVRGAVTNLRPLSKAGTWHMLVRDDARCLVHADRLGDVDALLGDSKRLGKLVVEGDAIVAVDKALRDDADLVAAVRSGQDVEGGLLLPVGDAERVEVQVVRDGRNAVIFSLAVA